MLNLEKVHHCGGILADDMGLGKTFQTLALIVNHPQWEDASDTHRPESARKFGTTLIVMPLSLIPQWKNEITSKISTPLKVGVYHGTDRKKMVFSEYDIVLTTYACLAKDLFAYIEAQQQQQPTAQNRFHPYGSAGSAGKKGKGEKQGANLLDFNWYRAILDECQQIKNIKCVTAKAAHEVKARYRWCLSGTPVQNKRREFMSLYRFVMGRVTNSVTRAIEDMEGYILRRTKDAVLQLPEKEIDCSTTLMSDEEKNIYKSFEEESSEKVYDLLHGGSMMKSMHNILLILLRMRQFSDHPRLVSPDCSIRYSSKQQKIMRILRDVRQNVDGKVVVFSTFVEMLRLLESNLIKLGWKYSFFHGGMNGGQREKALECFNTDPDCNILLMSTKAGSVGLNLTTAKTVILTEPWWNPFVDEQAMDRVHRIGQDSAVKVHQLIMKDTIEERILTLQKNKKRMFAEIFDKYGGTSGNTGLSRTDIEYLFKLDAPLNFNLKGIFADT